MQKAERSGTGNFTLEYMVLNFYRAGLFPDEGMVKLNIAGYFKGSVGIGAYKLPILLQFNGLF